MTEHLSFDATPDPELGAALRVALDAGDDRAFVARVRAQLAATPAWWEVLGTWSRPGLAAAIALIALTGLWLGSQARSGNGFLDEALAAATPGTVAALLASERPPTVDVLLAVAQPR